MADFIEDRSNSFQKLSKTLSCHPNRFIRTSRDKDHSKVVQETWTKMKTFIKRLPYTGYYSLSDESFISSKNLTSKNGKLYSKKSGNEVTMVSEDNYCFDISSFSSKLSTFLSSSIRPASRLLDIGDGVEDIIKKRLNDPISISRLRKSDSWGITVPDDPSQIVYVWMDALLSYYTSLKSLFGNQKNKDVEIHHVLGKDILKFHCLLWPSMIFASQILPSPPKRLLVHGHWTISGAKVSKSSPVLSLPTPEDIIDKLFKGNCDPLRYFLIKESRLDSDNEFSIASLLKTTNQDLSNQLGNLINRSFNSSFITKLPKQHCSSNEELASFLRAIVVEFEESMRIGQFHNAIHIACRILARGNSIFSEGKPWDLKVDANRGNSLEDIIGDVSLCLITWSKLMWPIVPGTAEKVLGIFGIKKEREDCSVDLSRPIIFPTSSVKAMFPRTII